MSKHENMELFNDFTAVIQKKFGLISNYVKIHNCLF